MFPLFLRGSLDRRRAVFGFLSRYQPGAAKRIGRQASQYEYPGTLLHFPAMEGVLRVGESIE